MYRCFLVLLVFAGISPFSRADVNAEKARELAEIHAKRQRMGADVKKLATQRSDQTEQLKLLEKQYGDKINDLNSLKSEIQQQEQILQEVRNKIGARQKAIQIQRLGLEGLIKSAHAMGEKQGLDVLLNQNDPALSGRMLAYYAYISKARVQKLGVINEDMKALHLLESQKETENQLLQVGLDKKRQETEQLQVLKLQREKLLSQIEQDFTLKQKQLTDLIHDEKKLEALLVSLQKTDDNAVQPPVSEPVLSKPIVKRQSQQTQEIVVAHPVEQSQAKVSFADLQGKLPWPVQGAIVERFGSKRFETTWDGTVIGAREGASIRAVAEGRVVYADWLRGYGLMIIVDHGRGFMSLYAFNQSLHKAVGEKVKAGEHLASVGRSGGRSRASLYFGIRNKGKAVNPEKWCRKPGKG